MDGARYENAHGATGGRVRVNLWGQPQGGQAATREGSGLRFKGVVGHHDQPLTQGPTIVIGRKGSIGEINWSNVPCFPIDTTYFVERTLIPCDLRWLCFTLLALDLTRFNKSAAVRSLLRRAFAEAA